MNVEPGDSLAHLSFTAAAFNRRLEKRENVPRQILTGRLFCRLVLLWFIVAMQSILLGKEGLVFLDEEEEEDRKIGQIK